MSSKKEVLSSNYNYRYAGSRTPTLESFDESISLRRLRKGVHPLSFSKKEENSPRHYDSDTGSSSYLPLNVNDNDDAAHGSRNPSTVILHPSDGSETIDMPVNVDGGSPSPPQVIVVDNDADHSAKLIICPRCSFACSASPSNENNLSPPSMTSDDEGDAASFYSLPSSLNEHNNEDNKSSSFSSSPSSAEKGRHHRHHRSLRRHLHHRHHHAQSFKSKYSANKKKWEEKGQKIKNDWLEFKVESSERNQRFKDNFWKILGYEPRSGESHSEE